MSKLILPPGVVNNAGLLERGIVQIARPFDNLTSAIAKEEIPDYLGLLDHSREMGKDEYKKRLREEQERRDRNLRTFREKRFAVIVVLEGRDAAGKSGFTKYLVQYVDFEGYDVVHVKAPNDEERTHAYWLRFFDRDRMPAFGQLRVFDRSWYGDLLVVPVDGLASKKQVKLTYSQLRTMEWLLDSSNILVCKLWFDITKAEQKERFEDRKEENNGKYQESDIKARGQWKQYTPYIQKMFHYTGTPFAPWNAIPGDCKKFARVTAMTVVNDAMEGFIAERG